MRLSRELSTVVVAVNVPLPTVPEIVVEPALPRWDQYLATVRADVPVVVRTVVRTVVILARLPNRYPTTK